MPFTIILISVDRPSGSLEFRPPEQKEPLVPYSSGGFFLYKLGLRDSSETAPSEKPGGRRLKSRQKGCATLSDTCDGVTDQSALNALMIEWDDYCHTVVGMNQLGAVEGVIAHIEAVEAGTPLKPLSDISDIDTRPKSPTSLTSANDNYEEEGLVGLA